MSEGSPGRIWLPFLSGILAGAAGAVITQALSPRRGLDPRLIKHRRDDPALPPVIVIPGILGTELLRPDGTQAWLNVGNALGHHDLSLPLKLPLSESRDDLRPGGLLGVDAVLPRLFGFTEYAELLDLLDEAGFARDRDPRLPGAAYYVVGYDWRRDLVEAARQLDAFLEELAAASGDPERRFNLIGHSMGGLIARYYLRYGTAEPDRPVSWAGARRIQNLLLVATPNAGSVHALNAVISGERVGLSATTLAADVIGRMPALFQLLPPAGAPTLVDERCQSLDANLLDIETWRSFGWGPFAQARRSRARQAQVPPAEERIEFLTGVLDRASRVHEALNRKPGSGCPAHVTLLGGDCLPTLARAIVSRRPGVAPRFEPRSVEEGEVLLEAGDGRVTRASALASHLPEAQASDSGCGLPEVRTTLFGCADHHGIYSEPTFQSLLLRLLLRPPQRSLAGPPDR